MHMCACTSVCMSVLDMELEVEGNRVVTTASRALTLAVVQMDMYLSIMLGSRTQVIFYS